MFEKAEEISTRVGDDVPLAAHDLRSSVETAWRARSRRCLCEAISIQAVASPSIIANPMESLAAEITRQYFRSATCRENAIIAFAQQVILTPATATTIVRGNQFCRSCVFFVQRFNQNSSGKKI
jgi:hypothetical protein